jgi:3-oxoacyl-[acyl-carrier protein] reductase
MSPGTSRVVLISGGSRGLGAALVEAFLAQGDRVASFARGESEAVAGWRQSYPEQFLFDSLDMCDREACAAYLERVQSHWGDVQVLVNNAGVAHTSLLALEQAEDIDALLDLNLGATIHLTRLVSRPMLALDGGRIINISSVVGLSGYRGLSVYGASKAALDGFTRALARELGSRAITVNSVAPGYLDTDMTEELEEAQLRRIVGRTPLGRLGGGEDVAAAVCFLASDAAAFITGQVLVVDGGLSC